MAEISKIALTNAVFDNAVVVGCDFRGANITGCDFKKCAEFAENRFE